MEKLPLKHHSSSQKDELLKGETLFDESLNKSLTIAMNAPLSFDDFAHSADGLKILDACFSGAICSTVTLQSTFERLVHTYQAYLLFIAYQILEHWCAAEDIVQETWGKTFVYLKRRCEGDEQVDISRIRGFLAVTARNTALNYKKHEHHLHFVPLETLHGEKIEEIETIEADKLEQPEFLFIQNES
ncbi:MAG: RNA polymerase sigma factor, partial [Ktedonobacteraceae bacterium]